MSDSKKQESRSRRHGQSLFGPFMLIAIGVYFLLNNLGLIPNVNWQAAIQLWPLLFIFLGLNALVRQVPRPFGTFLSGLVALTAVLLLGYILFFGANNPLLKRFQLVNHSAIQRQEIEMPNRGVNSAEIGLDLNAAGAHIFTLDDSPHLLQGTVAYIDDFVFEPSVTDKRATVLVDSDLKAVHFFNGLNFAPEDQWQIGLNAGIPTDLTIRAGAGEVVLALQKMNLTSFLLSGGIGNTELALPDGDYTATLNMGVGATAVTLPANGRSAIQLDGGTGNMTFALPSTMEARFVVNSGVGRLRVDDGRLSQISDQESDNSIWQTAHYNADSANAVVVTLNVGVGNVTIQPQE